MYFEHSLDETLGPRKIYYVIKCFTCGFDEIYYIDPVTEKLIGRACAKCNNIQSFDLKKRPSTINT